MTQCNARKYEFQGIKSRRVEGGFDGGMISSEGGALLLRELIEGKGYLKDFAKCFADHRNPDLIEHSLEALLRQRVVGLCLGYEDLNDHDELRRDPLLSLVCGESDIEGQRRHRAEDRGIPLAGKSTLNRLELTPEDASPSNRYKKIVYDTVAVESYFVETFLDSYSKPPKGIVLDLDATDIPLFGHQEGRFYHGYYDCYCYLPLYIFCGDELVSALLRPSNIDGSYGSVEEVERVISQIRERWPEVEILLRGDSGFARDDLLDWCEENAVHYLFGLAQNERLVAAIPAELAAAERQFKETGQPARVFKDFRYSTLDSWSSQRRVVAKAEYLEKGTNPRFVVTSLEPQHVSAAELYEKYYCLRGDMENRIKEQQLCLFADRASAETMRANQLRVWFSGVAYLILNAFRKIALAGTKLARAQCDTIRNKLLKIGTKVRISARRVYLSFSSAFPNKDIFEHALQVLSAPT